MCSVLRARSLLLHRYSLFSIDRRNSAPRPSQRFFKSGSVAGRPASLFLLEFLFYPVSLLVRPMFTLLYFTLYFTLFYPYEKIR